MTLGPRRCARRKTTSTRKRAAAWSPAKRSIRLSTGSWHLRVPDLHPAVVCDVNVYVHAVADQRSHWPLLRTIPPTTSNAEADCLSLAFGVGTFRPMASPPHPDEHRAHSRRARRQPDSRESGDDRNRRPRRNVRRSGRRTRAHCVRRRGPRAQPRHGPRRSHRRNPRRVQRHRPDRAGPMARMPPDPAPPRLRRAHGDDTPQPVVKTIDKMNMTAREPAQSSPMNADTAHHSPNIPMLVIGATPSATTSILS